MNRIDQIFADLRRDGSRGLMPFITAGVPDLAVTAELLVAIQRAGAVVCEVGIPFSDPIADGPVIAASMAQAVERGVRPVDVLKMVASVRARLNMGLLAMVSYSVVYRLGIGPFLRDAASAGFDGFIFPDLPVEESEAVVDQVADLGLVSSMLVAPTTPIDRAHRIARSCSGFVYVLARTGLTGERGGVPRELGPRIERLRAATDLPMAVGFGISNRQQVRQVVAVADAAIVGSAIMRRIGEHLKGRGTALADDVERFVVDLVTGLRPDGGLG